MKPLTRYDLVNGQMVESEHGGYCDYVEASMPMNRDIRAGVKVAARVVVYPQYIKEPPVPFNAVGVVAEGDGHLYVGHQGGETSIYCEDFDLTGCFEVVEEAKKMTIREYAERAHSHPAGWATAEQLLTAALNGKKEFERLLSEQLGYKVEIVDG